MSTCWKCGRETSGESRECKPFCEFDQLRADTVRRMEDAARDTQQNSAPLDFSKFKTLEDVVEFLSIFYGCYAVDRRHPIYQRLKKFTADPPNPS